MDNIKKTAFLAKYEATLGNISQSCKAADISRQTFYNWLESDSDFRQSVDALNESCIDFAESSLKKQIQDGDTTATIFYLKTKGKSRGYVEKKEIEINSEQQQGASQALDLLLGRKDNGSEA